MDVKIYPDGTLKKAYGWLAVIFLFIAGVAYLLDSAHSYNFTFGAGLLFLLFLAHFDSGAVLSIDQHGLQKKRHPIIKWRDVKLLKFEKRRFENSGWIVFLIASGNSKKPVEIILKRTTANPQELFGHLRQYIQDCGFDIVLEGLEEW